MKYINWESWFITSATLMLIVLAVGMFNFENVIVDAYMITLAIAFSNVVCCMIYGGFKDYNDDKGDDMNDMSDT